MRLDANGRCVFDVPDQISPEQIGALLAPRLVGTSSTGDPDLAGKPPSRVVWLSGADEALVHLDSIHARIVAGSLLISIELETDQSGRQPLIVAFALGTKSDPAGLIAATDELPRGNEILVSRWGAVVRDAVWAALIGVARAHAGERNAHPLAMVIDGQELLLTVRS